MLCIKISENPQNRFFFTIAGPRDENEYYITQAFFYPLNMNFTTTRSDFLGHPIENLPLLWLNH